MSNTIFVRNLAYGTTQQQLEELFGDIGPVKKVSVIKDKGRAKTDMTTRGFAFVKLYDRRNAIDNGLTISCFSAMEADAQLAIEKLNNTEYMGRKLGIDIAKEKKGPKPLAHQKQPPSEETQQEDLETTTTKEKSKKRPREEDEVDDTNEIVETKKQSDKSKEAKGKKHQKDEESADVPEVSEKKAKKAKKKAKTVEVDEETAEQPDVVAEKPEKSKRVKKAKKAKAEEVEEETVEQSEIVAEEPEKKSIKAKKAKKAKAEEAPEKPQEEKTVQEKESVADKNQGENEESRVQSERNARRRQHRELLRKMKERQEATASADEKSIAIYGLGANITEKALKIKMKKIGESTKIEWKEDVVNGETQHVAIVEWKNLDTKQKALEKLDQHVFKGYTMTVRGLESTVTGISQKEGVRLIVRNLQFDVKDADLTKLFGQHGPLAEARVVRLPSESPETGALGRSRGFGFVQFKNRVDAQKAIEALNNAKLKGRQLVVDYAVAKSEYLKAQAPKEENADEDKAEEGDEANENNENEDEGDEDNEDDGEDEEGDVPDEIGDDENTLEMDDEDIEGEDEDDEEDEPKASSKPKVDTESQRERTVFIRNLSFQTSEEGLSEAFSTEFGPVEYARIVMDKGSGLSKGVAFVRFRSKEHADAAIARGTPKVEDPKKKKKNAAQDIFFSSAMLDGDGIYVDGRLLSVTRSVAKDDADRLTEENSAKRKAVDKRNMYLAYEGTINVNKTADTELELPKMDIEKRRRAIKEKKEKLKNPLFFISPVRLSVRNLALSVDEKTLKTVFREGAIEGLREGLVNMKDVKGEYQLEKGVPVKIKLAKIVRDVDNVKPGEGPRSRGYGFVEFSQHVHALAALRKLNNNPAYTQYSGRGVKPARGAQDKDKTRLIIEFALENHGKLKLREKRMNDAKKRRDEDKMLRKAQGEEVPEKVERKSRGKRQREAKALRAKEADEKSTDEPAPKKAKTNPSTAAPKPKPTPKQAPKAKPAKAPAVPSRKERKNAKSRKEEKSFDELVNNYKKKLFATVDESESRGRWFD
ncbi:unnamed protein product [Aphanomyces euteiches]